MDDSIVSELQDVINVICLLEAKENAFRQDLEYYFDNKERYRSWLGPLKRLEHEVMFLCIDTYSLYEGISKRKSLYAKIIKQCAKQFSQIDKEPTCTVNNTAHLGFLEGDGFHNAGADEKFYLINALNEKAIQFRKDIKDRVGIISHKHSNMDAWNIDLVDRKAIETLGTYRNDFSHRLDSLSKLKQELTLRNPCRIGDMLDVISLVLAEYKTCFQDILSYTTLTHYAGMSGFRLDSISRIRQWEEYNSPK